MSPDTSEMEQFVRAEVEKFASMIRKTDSIILPFLRFHLLTENLLERIIICHLARSDRFLDKTNPRYHHKLCLVDSFDMLADNVMTAMKNLNSIRNSLVHSKVESISIKDIDEIGRPFGKEYSQLRAVYLNDIRELMCCVFELILFGLLPKVYQLEHSLVPKTDE